MASSSSLRRIAVRLGRVADGTMKQRKAMLSPIASPKCTAPRGAIAHSRKRATSPRPARWVHSPPSLTPARWRALRWGSAPYPGRGDHRGGSRGRGHRRPLRRDARARDLGPTLPLASRLRGAAGGLPGAGRGHCKPDRGNGGARARPSPGGARGPGRRAPGAGAGGRPAERPGAPRGLSLDSLSTAVPSSQSKPARPRWGRTSLPGAR